MLQMVPNFGHLLPSDVEPFVVKDLQVLLYVHLPYQWATDPDGKQGYHFSQVAYYLRTQYLLQLYLSVFLEIAKPLVPFPVRTLPFQPMFFSFYRDISTWMRLQMVFRERGGVFGLYRGIVPGSIRSFLANGCAMIVMSFAQRKVTELGLRG